MKCCVSTNVGTWTKLLTFEPDSDHSPDAGTGLLSPISYALQRGFLLRRENPTCGYWAPVAAATRGFIHREPWEQLCWKYMRSTECLSSLFVRSFVSLSPVKFVKLFAMRQHLAVNGSLSYRL